MRQSLLQVLYATPLLLALSLGVLVAAQRIAADSVAARAYASAESALQAGRYDLAYEHFVEASGYLDADRRRDEMVTALAPYRAAYLDGVEAFDAGNYEVAVSSLLPVARDLPDFEDVAPRLAAARRARATELRGQADLAISRHEWIEAEQALVDLATVDPGDERLPAELAKLQREHGALVYSHDRALYLSNPDGSEERLLTDAVTVTWPTWSPDRSRIAFISIDPEDTNSDVGLYVIDADGSGLTRLANDVANHTPPVWSPDGAHLAYTSFAAFDVTHDQGIIGVRTVEVATGIERDLTGMELPLAFNPTWSPTGDRIAFVSKDQQYSRRPQTVPGDVMVVSLDTGAIANLTNGKVRDVWSVHWSPIAEEILVYSLYGESWYEAPETSIRFLDVATGGLQLIASPPDVVYPPTWSPDGSRYAFVDGNRVIVIYLGGEEERRVEPDEELSGRLTWAPDGGALFAAGVFSRPSVVIPLESDLTTPQLVSLDFDLDPPFVGPPYWAPIVAPPRQPASSLGGAGLDSQ